MVGFCGVFGDRGHEFSSLDAVDSFLCLTGEERRQEYRSDRADVVVSTHSLFADDQPATLADDRLLWIWGDVRGYDAEDGYRSRETTTGTAGLCAELYDRYGEGFVDRLNGEFVGVVHDPDEATVSIFTDRLGSRPVFVARGEDGELLVSTQLQLFPKYPGFETAFDEAFVCEYLTYNFVFGVETPLEGVRKAPPASVVEYDLETGTSTASRYWYPTYEPTDLSYREYVGEFAATLRDVVADCLVADADHGLSLSGGSDSRLLAGLLADLGADVTSFHMADWEGREARIARRVAGAVGSEFRLLERDESYLSERLTLSPRLNTFNGWFQEGHELGFDELAETMDVVLFGWGSDAFFKEYLMPLRTVSLLGETVALPLQRPVDGVEEYLDVKSRPAREYVPSFETTRPILAANVHERGPEVLHHGVAYRSPADLARQGAYFPITNDRDFFHYGSSIQLLPHRTPFLDHRMLDLHLSTPARFRTRRGIVDDAVEAVSPGLAAIPHGTTWLPLSYPYLAHWAVEELPPLRWLRDLVRPDSTPADHLSDGPWPDHDNLLRKTDFGENAIADAWNVIEALPFVDGAAYRRAYRDQTEGANHWRAIYALLTLAEMPVTADLVDRD